MDSIIRGTNATIQFEITDDIDFSKLSSLELYIRQAGNVIVKQQDDLILNAVSKTISYETTQEESLSFIPCRSVTIILVGLYDGKRFEARPIVKAYVEDTPKNEVLA